MENNLGNQLLILSKYSQNARRRIEAFKPYHVQEAKKRRTFTKPLANSTFQHINQLSESHVDAGASSCKGNSNKTFLVEDKHCKEENTLKQKEKISYETPLSSKQEGSLSASKALPSSKNLLCKPKHLMDITNANKPASYKSSEPEDGVLKTLTSHSEAASNKKSLNFDLSIENESDEEITIHRAKRFPLWCLSRNFRSMARLQSRINIDGG